MSASRWVKEAFKGPYLPQFAKWGVQTWTLLVGVVTIVLIGVLMAVTLDTTAKTTVAEQARSREILRHMEVQNQFFVCILKHVPEERSQADTDRCLQILEANDG